MRLRARLLLAQAPLAAALLAVALLAVGPGALSGRLEWLTLAGAALAVAAALVLSLRLTERVLRPLGVLRQAARRFGAGDLQARARLPGDDEVARLAGEWNAMAERLEALQRAQAEQLEQARQALAARSTPLAGDPATDLVATVAHELKTPLTSLRMALHLLAEGVAGPLAEKQSDLVLSARQDCERIQALVDDVLGSLRPELSGALEISPVEPRALLEEVAGAHRSAAEAGSVRLQVELLPGLAPLRADRDRLRVALSNLVANALRHTPPGGNVTLACHEEAAGPRLEVRDTGAGIGPEHLARVFERFYRVPGGGSQGSGLGLWIVREVARAHGGGAGAESQPGRGSRFWIQLPPVG